ncbi:MAG: copper homeostasis protein CutC [Terracidiphilus sp.]
MKPLRFELCVESLEAARAARAGGADRIELCTGLTQGGVTPPVELMRATVRAVSIPVSVLIRPRHGSFCFTDGEFDVMRRQIDEARRAGAAAVAMGVLLADGRVDVPRTRQLIDRAAPMTATFHRAFDETPDLLTALEDVIATGASCLLTSGGQAEVLAGADMIACVRKKAGDRLDVMAGGGLRLDNLAEVVRRSGVSLLHGSLTRGNGKNGSGTLDGGRAAALEEDLREAILLFHREHEARAAAE